MILGVKMNQVSYFYDGSILVFHFLFFFQKREGARCNFEDVQISPSDLGKVKQEVQGSKRVAAEGEKEN